MAENYLPGPSTRPNGTLPAKVHRGKVTEIVLGLGEVVVGHSTDYLGGLPAITFSPAPAPGVVGDDFKPRGPYVLREGSVVLVFATKQAVLIHLERLKMLVDALAAPPSGTV